MKGLKKVIVILIAAFVLAIIGGGAATVANAAPAEASVAVVQTVTPTVIGGDMGGGIQPIYTDRWWHYQYNCMPYPSGAFQWRDFDWWEEMWGERDRYVWKFNFYRYC